MAKLEIRLKPTELINILIEAVASKNFKKTTFSGSIVYCDEYCVKYFSISSTDEKISFSISLQEAVEICRQYLVKEGISQFEDSEKMSFAQTFKNKYELKLLRLEAKLDLS